MRVKPQRPGLLTRSFERQGDVFLVVTPLVFFVLGASPTVLTEVDMRKAVAPPLGGRALDQAMPKLRTVRSVIHGDQHASVPDGSLVTSEIHGAANAHVLDRAARRS